MKPTKTLVAAAITTALTFGAVTVQAGIAETGKQTTDRQGHFKPQEQVRYIVKFKPASNLSAKAAKTGQTMAQLQKASNLNNLSKFGVASLLHMDNANAAAVHLNKMQLRALRNDPNVEYIEVDPKRYLIDTVTRHFENETPSDQEVLAESKPYGISMVQADQVSDSQTSNIKVCITDTGYEGNHEDLRPHTDAGITGDDSDGLGNDTGNWWEPGHSHGTHVAGTIAALGNNGTGVVGVNGSGLLDLHNVKIFNNAGTWAYGSNLVKAIEQCRDSGSKVISMSIGGGDSSVTEENAFISAVSAGVINIAAAGNDGNTSLSYPASYDSVMSVAAIDSSKNLASFSQRNAQVEIAAPGVSVRSTVLNNGYQSMSGTSMATPHVAGVAALVWSRHSQCSSEQIRAAMNATAQDLGSSGRDNSYGYGLVQAKAMDDALANGCVVDPTIPTVPGILDNGVPHTGLEGATAQQLTFTMDVPADATDVKFDMSGGTGDADLYVKFGSAPTLSSYDCRPWKGGNSESCTGASAGGKYHVMINGYSTFSGVSLTGSYGDGSVPGGGTYSNNSDVTIVDNTTVTSPISVTGNGDSGSVTVKVDIKHTYANDLKLTLVAPDGTQSVLREYTGGSADNVVATYTIDGTGIERNGEWQLQVNDNANADAGYIDSWTLSF
ncbi:MAG: serine protease [Phenylobacterium sp.]|jgi:serine protease